MNTDSVIFGITARAAVESAPPLKERACRPEVTLSIGDTAPSSKITLIREITLVASMNRVDTGHPILNSSEQKGRVFRMATRARRSG
jgi:hypothetical protein